MVHNGNCQNEIADAQGADATRWAGTVSEIPPVTTTLGDIETRLPEIQARVAANLHVVADDPWVEQAVDAAVVYVIDYTARNDVGLPDDNLTAAGLVLFGTRIYLDAFSPGGAQVAVADPTFEPIFQPEHLFKHVRHYFMRLTSQWGVA
jgi:hypothetical protein